MVLMRAHDGFMWKNERGKKDRRQHVKAMLDFCNNLYLFIYLFLHTGNMHVRVMRKVINRQKRFLVLCSNNSI